MVRISVELPDELAEALGRAATEMQSSRDAILVSALSAYLEPQDAIERFAADRAAFNAWIAEGEADVAAGRIVPAEEVFADLDAIITAAGKRRDE